jgi:hypothetical protein
MEHQEGAGDPRRRAQKGGEPIQFGITEFESNSESRTIQINVQITYDLCFGCSTYARKTNEITFPMAPVSCPTKIRVVRNHQNTTNLQNSFWYCATILARWAVYPVGVPQRRVLGFSHDPRPFIFSSHHHFMCVLLRLICQFGL